MLFTGVPPMVTFATATPAGGKRNRKLSATIATQELSARGRGLPRAAQCKVNMCYHPVNVCTRLAAGWPLLGAK